MRVASQELKKVDPSNHVVSPSAVGSEGITWLEEFLREGGGRYVDIIGFHFYVVPRPPEAMVPLIGNVRAIMAKYGAGDKPLWNTEAGWYIENLMDDASTPRPSPIAISDSEASAYVARAYILNWAAGVTRFYWYAWDNKLMGLTEANGVTPKRSARAYAEVGKWLVGARMMSCASDENGTWICHLTRRHGYQGWILWAPDGETRFRIPAGWAVRQWRDLGGNEGDVAAPQEMDIGPFPVLLQNSPQ